jgi:hypothetical protein
VISFGEGDAAQRYRQDGAKERCHKRLYNERYATSLTHPASRSDAGRLHRKGGVDGGARRCRVACSYA